MTIIDFRSDTVTLPVEGMLDAMRRAPLGDDGLDGDPTVRRLEELAAATLGKEKALFVVSGTMGNLVAAMAHATYGGEAIVDAQAHIAVSEAGGISRVAGLMCRQLPAMRGVMDIDEVASTLRNGYTRHGQPTAMVVVESSHNNSGGAVPPLQYMRALYQTAHEAGSQIHLDGARIFNAAAAIDCDAKTISSHADSVTFCLSKGLSAPMGSVLAGSASFICRARTYRRMVGGGLRQAGVVAAAGVVALETMVKRLADDNRMAARFWVLLNQLHPECVEPTPPETNILMVRVADSCYGTAVQFAKRLATHGILARARDAHTLRFVMHRHISSEDIQVAARTIDDLLKGR
jgi:threonine aldolase